MFVVIVRRLSTAFWWNHICLFELLFSTKKHQIFNTQDIQMSGTEYQVRIICLQYLSTHYHHLSHHEDAVDLDESGHQVVV